MLRIKALERGQAMMENVLSRKFDESTPTGGVPACDSTAGDPCSGIVADLEYDDVGDFNGFNDTTDALYPVSISVVDAGADLGLVADRARRITVVVSMPDGNTLTLSAYKVNF